MTPILSSLKTQLFLLILSLTIYLTHSEQDTITFCYRNPQCYELNDFSFNDKFRDLRNKFNTVTTIRIHAMQLSQVNYIKLFSHPLPQLKTLIFQNHDRYNVRNQHQLKNILTPKIVENIFTAKFFTQLQELDMSCTNLDFKHFLFLDDDYLQITSNLKNLILISNFLQKRAFTLISKINFQGKLETLALAENSLISSQSIDSILKIIHSPQSQKSQLRNLTVYGTSISTNHLIKLLDNIQTSKMTNLNIGMYLLNLSQVTNLSLISAHNALQHSKSFKIPFNNTIFQYLSKCNFSSLSSLIMSQMDLDDQQLPYLKKLKLPSLQRLDLQGNFITDNYFKQWIIQKNMPKLTHLGISQNDITDHGIQLFVNEKFQNISILILNNNRRLTSNYLIHLSKLNTSKLTNLQMMHNTMFEKDMRIFFGKSFEQLQILTIGYVNDGFDFFEYVNWKSMKNLRFLDILETDFSQSLELITKNNITFPKLKVFNFGGLWLTKQQISKMLRNLTALGPHLQQTRFTASLMNPHTTYFNLSDINPQTIPNGMYLVSDSLVVYKQIQTQRLQIINVDFGSGTYNFFYTMFDYSYFGNYAENDAFWTTFYYNVTQLEMVINHIEQLADWQNVENFYMGTLQDFNILLRLYFFEHQEYVMTYYNENYNFIKYRQDFPSTIFFPYLQDISYIPSQEGYMPNAPKFLYYMNKMKAPLLRLVQFGYQHDESYPGFLNKLLKTHKNIKNLVMIGNGIDCQLFQYITNGIKFPFLQEVVFARNQIETQCLSNFFANHPTIRKMEVSGNFLQKGLFEKVIIKNQLILSYLGISYMQIGNIQFAKMAKINLQFFQILSASTTNINSQGIKMLVRNNTAEKMFPKCEQIDLTNNFINEQGVGTLLATGMPFIRQLILYHVNNPNLFNEMFSYPNNFGLIAIQDANIYGIDPNLDKRSTRHVTTLQLQSPSLGLQDFEVLSKMNLGKLLNIALLVENIYECEILEHILKIVQNADQLAILITNEKNKYKRLDDKCLKPNDPSQNYMRHLKIFNILWQSEFSYIPNFYTYFYSSNQLVTALVLANSLIGDDVMIEIVDNCNLQHLYVGVLQNNLLTDKSITKLFSLPLNQLKQLILVNNDFTYKSLQPLQNKVLEQMIGLDISMNPLGDEAIDILSHVKFPKLMGLTLNNVDLTVEGLKKLSKLQAPQLFQLSIANNLFDEYDFIEFIETFQIENFSVLTKIMTNLQISESNMLRISSIISKRNYPTRFNIDYYQYRLKMDNKAEM